MIAWTQLARIISLGKWRLGLLFELLESGHATGAPWDPEKAWREDVSPTRPNTPTMIRIQDLQATQKKTEPHAIPRADIISR